MLGGQWIYSQMIPWNVVFERSIVSPSMGPIVHQIGAQTGRVPSKHALDAISSRVRMDSQYMLALSLETANTRTRSLNIKLGVLQPRNTSYTLVSARTDERHFIKIKLAFPRKPGVTASNKQSGECSRVLGK